MKNLYKISFIFLCVLMVAVFTNDYLIYKRLKHYKTHNTLDKEISENMNKELFINYLLSIASKNRKIIIEKENGELELDSVIQKIASFNEISKEHIKLVTRHHLMIKGEHIRLVSQGK